MHRKQPSPLRALNFAPVGLEGACSRGREAPSIRPFRGGGLMAGSHAASPRAVYGIGGAPRARARTRLRRQDAAEGERMLHHHLGLTSVVS
jgi:hypothetical protein